MGNKAILLTEGHFEECPVWRFDEDSDGFYPVNEPEALPENIRDLRTAVVFTTHDGQSFNGYIVGAGRVFSIGIFKDGKTFHFNNNMPAVINQESLNNLLSASSPLAGNIFPARYETKMQWQDKGFNNFSGEFDAFNKALS